MVKIFCSCILILILILPIASQAEDDTLEVFIDSECLTVLSVGCVILASFASCDRRPSAYLVAGAMFFCSGSVG